MTACLYARNSYEPPKLQEIAKCIFTLPVLRGVYATTIGPFCSIKILTCCSDRYVSQCNQNQLSAVESESDKERTLSTKIEDNDYSSSPGISQKAVTNLKLMS